MQDDFVRGEKLFVERISKSEIVPLAHFKKPANSLTRSRYLWGLEMRIKRNVAD